MKKRIILFFIVLTLKVGSTVAQTNENEAKAAYLLAEESYAKNDYKTALNYLDEAKKNLGSANSKILYLQIQVQMELFKTDRSYLNKALQSIAEIEAAPDYKDFTEEKSLEVSKIKLQLKNELKRDEQLKKAAAVKKADALKKFATFSPYNRPVNIPLAELKLKYPQDPLLTGKLKNEKDDKYNLVMYYPSKYKLLQWPNYRVPINSGFFDFSTALEIYGIFIKDEIVKGYACLDFHLHEGGGKSYATATKEFEAYLNKYADLFGTQPKRVPRPGKGFYQSEDFVWESAEKIIVMEHTFGPSYRAVPWLISGTLCVIYK